jgi:hypothetical protein
MREIDVTRIVLRDWDENSQSEPVMVLMTTFRHLNGCKSQRSARRTRRREWVERQAKTLVDFSGLVNSS